MTKNGGDALSFIPLEPEDISREWLFSVINQFRTSRNLPLISSLDDITDCCIDECEQSHGYLSTTYKLVANFNCSSEMSGPEESSYAFFLKMLPGVEEKHRRLLAETRVFPREVKALFEYLPSLKRFVADSKQPDLLDGLFPEIVYGSYDEDGSGIVCLMDLNEKGFFPLNHYLGFNSVQTLAVVERLAEFHAAGSALLLLRDQDGGLRKEMAASQRSQGDSQIVYETLSPFFKDFAKFLRKVPGFAHCYEKLKKIQPSLVSQLTRWERGESSFPMKAILHGELWEKNILLRYEQISEKLEVAFCDWKGLRVGCPIRDLAFLLLSCTNQSLRTKQQRAVVDKYYFTYLRTLKRLGVDFEKRFPDYGVENLEADLQEALSGAFIQSITVLTREERYLQSEYLNADERDEDTISLYGQHLRDLGRRLLEVAEVFVPILCAASEEKEINCGTRRNKSNKKPLDVNGNSRRI